MNRWIDFIRIKPLHVGGLTEVRKIMTLAEPFNVRSAFHGAADIGPIAQAASITLQSVIPNFGVQDLLGTPAKIDVPVADRLAIGPTDGSFTARQGGTVISP